MNWFGFDPMWPNKLEPKTKFERNALLIFLVFLAVILLWANFAHAGQIVCHDAEGKITNYGSGGPQSGCLYFSLPPNTQAEYDAVKLLFRTVPRRYIKVENGEVGEMNQGEKNAVDLEITSNNNTAIRAEAKSSLDGQLSSPLILRCMAKLMVDEINIVRQNPTSQLAPRTLAQAKTAMKTCVETGAADE